MRLTFQWGGWAIVSFLKIDKKSKDWDKCHERERWERRPLWGVPKRGGEQGRAFQADGTAVLKSERQARTWHHRGTGKRPVGLEWVGDMRGAESGDLAPQEASGCLLTFLKITSLLQSAPLAPRTHPCLAKSSPSSERKRKRVLFVAGGAYGEGMAIVVPMWIVDEKCPSDGDGVCCGSGATPASGRAAGPKLELAGSRPCLLLRPGTHA